MGAPNHSVDKNRVAFRFKKRTLSYYVPPCFPVYNLTTLKYYISSCKYYVCRITTCCMVHVQQGDSPETWRVDEFRMFERGSLWKPPPLKNLRSKLLPPLEDDVVRRGQLSTRLADKGEQLYECYT